MSETKTPLVVPTFDGRQSVQLLAVKTISGQTRILVPVSATLASNMSKQISTTSPSSQHQQILVVPTPGGGQRLVTSSVPGFTTSLLRNSNQRLNTEGMTRHTLAPKSLLTASTAVAASSMSHHRLLDNNNNNNSIFSSNRTTGSSVSAQPPPLTSFTAPPPPPLSSGGLVTRQQQQARLQHKQQQLQAEREAASSTPVTEERRKEHFLAALGLVTKAALSEIQNKKGERKRRTTANPQFSNAAIEAKRISALETAAKRQRRKEALAARQTLEEPERMSSRVNPTLKRAQQRQLINDVVKPPPAKIPKKSPPPPKPTLAPLPKCSPDCAECDELCEPHLDVVIICRDCRVIFHATCAASVEDMTESATVPCPRCEKKLPLSEEVTSAQLSTMICKKTKSKLKPEPPLRTNNKANSGTVTLNRENGSSPTWTRRFTLKQSWTNSALWSYQRSKPRSAGQK